MRRFSIRLRMLGAIATVMALFTLVGLTGLLGGRHLAELNTDFMHRSIKDLHSVGDLRHALGEVRRNEKDMVIHYEDGAAVLKARQAWAANIMQAKASFNELLQGEEDADNPIARASLTEIDAYVAGTTKVLDQIHAGAYDTALAADKMLARAKQHVQTVDKNVDAIETIIDAEAARAQTDFEASMKLTLWTFVGVLALVVLVVVPLTLLNSHSIIAPMQQARDLALAIADRDLTRTVQISGQDEAADLLRALAHMQASLGALVGEVREASQSIHTASNEVASGNSDLSGRTEQAAGNLQQATASLEQLTSAVRQSADSATQASQLAVTAGAVAHRGGEAVGQVVATMDEINQSSRRIADIIGTIDGIAFQTNILALNAAVEAARAGEQGRGFAVVAAEVRSLAQRSAAAAREIKTLIGTSVDRVEAGTRQVRAAGATMDEIVASVQRVTDIIGEITTAASGQSGGIVQVNSAVNNLDHMTQQNAALVEHSAAAAEHLSDQARSLTDIVARFRIEVS
jgi:methyl-accepting chemotaxis protein